MFNKLNAKKDQNTSFHTICVLLTVDDKQSIFSTVNGSAMDECISLDFSSTFIPLIAL